MGHPKRSLEELREIVQKVENLKASGTTAQDAEKKLGLPKNSYFQTRRRLRKLEANDQLLVREVRAVRSDEKLLRAENARLKQIVAEMALDLHALKEYHGR